MAKKLTTFGQEVADREGIILQMILGIGMPADTLTLLALQAAVTDTAERLLGRETLQPFVEMLERITGPHAHLFVTKDDGKPAATPPVMVPGPATMQ